MVATYSLKQQREASFFSQPETVKKERRSVSILGSTGTIGCNTLDVISHAPQDFEVVALSAGKNAQLLAQQAREYNAKFVAIADDAYYQELKDTLADTDIEVASGAAAVVEAACQPADWIMAAIVGAAGLRPTLSAVQQGACVALANKECLVSAGELFKHEVDKAGTILLPVDSEHSAVFQSLIGDIENGLEQITLTASGGPFRTWSYEQLCEVQPEQALKHPNWDMGAKITIDSATLMNKGLELIEAWHLFAVRADQLEVVVHPQSIIHCMVAYSDGSVMAQMSWPDMRTPIAYSLAWPQRMKAPTKRLDFVELGDLTFEAPDENRFPCLRIAKDILKSDGAGAAVLNAANEVAVEAFLSHQLAFTSIPIVIEKTLENFNLSLYTDTKYDLAKILEMDSEARHMAKNYISKI
ncbi:MAG: 1-deoxy-D-xylulose-5-phosphate reductoisomerase [Pseudomonadota bacterium]